MEKLKSNRLYLREFNEEDWRDVHKYASQERVSKHQPWGPNSTADTKAFISEVLVEAEKIPRTRYIFAIVLKEQEALIGAVEIFIKSFTNKSAEIGYIINPDQWGKGIATEAAAKIIDFGFSDLELHRIYATCAPDNQGSQKVLEKLGMSFEGRMRETILLKDGWRDSNLFSILVSEWPDKRGFLESEYENRR